MIRYRRNINCLTSNQLHDLREALAILYKLPASSPHSWLQIAGIHGEPAPSWCIHGYPGFATWHRAYLLALEEALHCLNPAVMVPFWNWSSGPTTGLPAACSSPTYVNRDGDTVPNPLYAGPLPAGGPGTMTERRPDIDTTTFGDLATTAQTALGNGDFNSFQPALNNVHGSIHGRVGGDMGSVPYAGFDPIFWLHHCNVDRLWAQWQASHPGPLPANEASLSLEPFQKPCSTSYYVGADMESTEALGYRYMTLCLIWIGPFVLTPIKLKLEPWVRERLEVAQLVVRATRMPAESFEVRVFINDPEANAATPTEDNPSYAGALGVFGMRGSPRPARGKKKKAAAKSGRAAAKAMDMPMRGDSFDLQVDITEALRKGLAGRSAPTITLVPVDLQGKQMPKGRLDFDGVELLAG